MVIRRPGPCDAYRGAWYGAYSCDWKLRSLYTGKAFRIIEDGGSTEIDIGFIGPRVDRAAIIAHGGSNKCRIVQHYDHSGGGNTITQATGSRQMEIYDGSAIVENADGVMSMHGTGSAARMHYKSASAPDAGFTQPATFFNYFEDIVMVNGGCRFDGAPSSGFGTLTQQDLDTSPWRRIKMYSGSHLTGPAGVDDMTTGVPYIGTFKFNGSSSSVRKNVQSETTGDAGTLNPNGVTWGGFSNAPGNSSAEQFATELLVADEATADAGQDIVRANMNYRYKAY